MGRWVDGNWVWDLRWRRDIFVWELNLLKNLLDVLIRSPISGADDSWCWRHNPSGFFSIKSAYLFICQSISDEVFISKEELRLLPKFWKTWPPSKVAVFYWQLLQDRLPTRHNL
ncbi:hypothetical protein TSUD_217460 [Trifolium subterraneum]|uniref:Reverse transcriptase zinc-binding domain-containing protein n=1 Tax=Trifolium subterraneum TaxID=3900 RepID=A0A2Z6MQ35_TRISU|nr:hypothetical protein TSUD_217460 [Trifolium subterraneum]